MLPERALEVRDWLRLARQDLLLAERALHQAPPLLESGGLHCQQAAEKSLKAFLVWNERIFPQNARVGFADLPLFATGRGVHGVIVAR